MLQSKQVLSESLGSLNHIFLLVPLKVIMSKFDFVSTVFFPLEGNLLSLTYTFFYKIKHRNIYIDSMGDSGDKSYPIFSLTAQVFSKYPLSSHCTLIIFRMP